MTHQHQSGASAESLSAENIRLARAVTKMAELLRDIAEHEPGARIAVRAILWNEREAIEAAARVWPPTGGE